VPRKTVARAAKKAARWKSREECLAARLAAAQSELGVVEPSAAERVRNTRREARERDAAGNNRRDGRFYRLAAEIAPALAELVTLQKAFVAHERERDPFDLAFYPEEREQAQREHDEMVREMTGQLLALRKVERWLREYSRPVKPAVLPKLSTRRGDPIRDAVIARAVSDSEMDAIFAAAAGSSPSHVRVRELAVTVIASGSEELPPGWRTMTVAQLIQHEMRATRLALARRMGGNTARAE